VDVSIGKKPLLSIGVPVYNGWKYIRETLDVDLPLTNQKFAKRSMQNLPPFS
jgi:hypothetical protein